MFYSTRYLNEKQDYEAATADIVSDGVLKTFSKKKSNLQIDDNKLLISPDESERRIIILLTFSIFILCCISSILSFKVTKTVFGNNNEFQPKVVIPGSYEMIQSNPMGRRHLTLIDSVGQLFDFQFHGNYNFTLSWQMKVPQSEDYFGFTNERKLFIIYGQGTQMTYLKSNQFHRTIPKSHPPIQTKFVGDSAHFNKYIWILGSLSLSSLTSGCESFYLLESIFKIFELSSYNRMNNNQNLHHFRPENSDILKFFQIFL